MLFVLYPDSESLVIVKRLEENEGSIHYHFTIPSLSSLCP